MKLAAAASCRCCTLASKPSTAVCVSCQSQNNSTQQQTLGKLYIHVFVVASKQTVLEYPVRIARTTSAAVLQAPLMQHVPPAARQRTACQWLASTADTATDPALQFAGRLQETAMLLSSAAVQLQSALLMLCGLQDSSAARPLP
jgi:hypothetical protein